MLWVELPQISGVNGVDDLLALQGADGLTWAKSGYGVKYLMDNCEVSWGLRSLARVEAAVYRDGLTAGRYQAAALQVLTGS